MSSPDGGASFVLDYELSADDLRDAVHVTLRASTRRRAARIINATTMAVGLIGAIASTVAALVIRQHLASCVSAAPTSHLMPNPAWVWQCDPGSPSALLWDVGGLLVAVVTLWYLGLSSSLSFWRATPQRQARRLIRVPGAAGRHRDEVATDGITSIGPDGTRTYLPWSGVSGVCETDQRFFLLGPGLRVRSVLPKRGLSDPDSGPRLGDLLRASAAGTSVS